MPEETPFRHPTSEELKGKKAPKGRPPTWPFLSMEVGQTISIDDKTRFHSARSSASRVTSISGKKFKSVLLDNGSLLIRRIS